MSADAWECPTCRGEGECDGVHQPPLLVLLDLFEAAPDAERWRSAADWFDLLDRFIVKVGDEAARDVARAKDLQQFCLKAAAVIEASADSWGWLADADGLRAVVEQMRDEQ